MRTLIPANSALDLACCLSFLAAAHGYSSDAFVELDVVLVTGELVTATATNKYSDIFWALKGGGNSFGIVTRYELEAINTDFDACRDFR
jgi:FAD/FMN-containing dehydrogenase